MLSNSGVWVKWNNNSGTAVSPNTLAANDIIMVALDCDANKVWFGKNGTWFDSGNPATGANAAYSNVYCNKYDIVACQATHTNVTNKVNFGQRSFAHTPPTGFNACCTGNLEEPTVVKSSDAFDVVTYVGTGAVRNITSLTFQPDFVWAKKRSGNATLRSHTIADSVRGATIQLLPDVTNAETTDTQGLKSFDSTGFTLGNSAGWNYVGDNYVAWCMRKGSQYGFDIQTYTGNGECTTNMLSIRLTLIRIVVFLIQLRHGLTPICTGMTPHRHPPLSLLAPAQMLTKTPPIMLCICGGLSRVFPRSSLMKGMGMLLGLTSIVGLGQDLF
jgi:hypothetical protein